MNQNIYGDFQICISVPLRNYKSLIFSYVTTVDTVKRVKETKPAIRNSRSSRPNVFCEKGVLRNFVKFT